MIKKYKEDLLSKLRYGHTHLTMTSKELMNDGLTEKNLDNLQGILRDLQSNVIELKVCLKINDFNNNKWKNNGK